MKKYSTNYAIKMLGFTVIALMAMLKPAFSQEPAVDNDLLTYSMAVSKDQQVKFRFPLDMRSGDRITGTVVEEKKNNAGVVNNASSSLEGVVIEIDGKQTKLSDRLFSFLVPAGITSLPFLLKNAAGEIIQKGELPVGIVADFENIEKQFAILPNGELHVLGNLFKPDAVCQPGQPLTISGNFDGNASTTNVSMGGQPCEVIAESNRMSFVQVSQNAGAGVTSVNIQENNSSEEHKVNVAVLNLSTNKTTLRKGEKATVTVSVSGLQGLEKGNDCRVRIENLSPTVVSIKGTGGNTFRQTIPQGLTADYKSTFNIVGVTQGNYTLSGVLYCAPIPQDKSAYGPEYKNWQEHYRYALKCRLLEEGFTENEIIDIIGDSFTPPGIIKNLWRLNNMRRAIKNARKDVGDPPAKDK